MKWKIFVSWMMGVVAYGLKCQNIEYEIVPYDVNKYTGIWYEYSHSDLFIFEKGCKCTFANYSILCEKEIKVENYCTKNGKEEYVEGTATLDPVIVGRLNVKFFKFAPSAPYDIIYLDEGYKIAVVLSCSVGNYIVWFLSRDPHPSIEQIQKANKSIPFSTQNQVIMEQNCRMKKKNESRK
jgi:apolipoprotein D and lipocalin family protein